MSSQLNPNLTYWTMLQDSTNIVWATDHFQVQNFHSQGQKVTNHPLWYSKLVTTPWKSSSWTKKQMLEIGNFEKPSCYSYLFLPPSYLSLVSFPPLIGCVLTNHSLWWDGSYVAAKSYTPKSRRSRWMCTRKTLTSPSRGPTETWWGDRAPGRR